MYLLDGQLHLTIGDKICCFYCLEMNENYREREFKFLSFVINYNVKIESD